MNQVTVSFDEEPLILVDGNDAVRGFDTKINAHRGSGILHRAFSVFLFDQHQRVLLQKRSQQKPLWPGFWSNSCCSHPRRGESYSVATRRRLQEELGVETELEYVYRFEYHAQFGDLGAEHELCTVFIGYLDGDLALQPNRAEIEEWGWFAISAVDRWVATGHTELTPWFLLEWNTLRGMYADQIEQMTAAASVRRPIAV